VAGDWIKLEHATLDKPEILELSELLSLSQGDALLLCLRFWVWLDEQTTDGRSFGRSNGRSGGISKHAIDALMRCPGFTNALIYVGWMGEEDGKLYVVDFEAHNGETAKKRALKNKSQAKWRGKRDVPVDAHVDEDVYHVRSTNVSTREEKRRGTNKQLSLIPDGWTPKPETVQTLTAQFSLRPEDVPLYITAFHDACNAKGYRYKDFDAAFRNCVRQDWPKLRLGIIPLNAPKRVAAG
jgi:hypothetical protein